MLRITVACVLLVTVLGWPSGAPEGACSNKIPQHGPGLKVGPTPKAFSIVAPATAKPGQTIKVVIKGGKFKGFLVQGVAAKTAAAKPIGSFVGGNTIQCSAVADTATHNNPTKQDYTSQTVSFKVPAGASTIFIRGTIVQDKLNYYNNVFSNAITVA